MTTLYKHNVNAVKRSFRDLNGFAKEYDFAPMYVTRYFSKAWQLTKNERARLFSGRVSLDELKPHDDLYRHLRDYIKNADRSDHDFIGNVLLLSFQSMVMLINITEDK